MKASIVLYCAMSEDGFIAAEKDNIDFLNDYHVDGEDYGYGHFLSTVETVLVGRKTYQKVLAMGYPYHEDKSVVVLSHAQPNVHRKNLRFYSGDLLKLCTDLKNTQQGIIYCDGGAQTAKALLALGLIDQMVLSILPMHLYKGTLLFKNGHIPKEFQLKNTTSYANGLVQNTFQKKIRSV
jgi:dihydrofolate reductase